MAKKERQKRSARKARAAERAEREAAIAREAEAKGIDPEVAVAASKEKKPAKPKDEKPGFFGRIKNWFHDVMTEMRRVVWPTPLLCRHWLAHRVWRPRVGCRHGSGCWSWCLRWY